MMFPITALHSAWVPTTSLYSSLIPPLFHWLVLSQLQTCWLPSVCERETGEDGCTHESHDLLKVESRTNIKCLTDVEEVLCLLAGNETSACLQRRVGRQSVASVVSWHLLSPQSGVCVIKTHMLTPNSCFILEQVRCAPCVFFLCDFWGCCGARLPLY